VSHTSSWGGRADFTGSMSENQASTPVPSTWPRRARWDDMFEHSQSEDHAAAVAQITSLLGNTRYLILTSTALLAADIAASAVITAALLGRKEISALCPLVLLVLVLLSWLRTSVLVILAERPVASAFGELRRATGAPVNPSVPWRPLGVRPMPCADLGWDQAVLLIAAVTLRHTRARLALSWAVITTAGVCLWMVLSCAIAALT
jgi:hypothetical protein